MSEQSEKSATVATQRLRDEILAGTYKPGERLKESELAAVLEVSRTPVREALMALQAEGLVELAPNRGATVRPYELADLDEMYDLRALLEGHAAARAATRITAEQIDALQKSLDRIMSYEVQTELKESISENLAFHGIILEAAQSPRLARLLDSVTQVPLVYRSYYWYSEELRDISQQFHSWIVKALRARDPERARQVASEHVLHARDVLVEHFRQAPAEH